MEWLILIPLVLLYLAAPIIALALAMRANRRLGQVEAELRRLAAGLRSISGSGQTNRAVADPAEQPPVQPGRPPLAEWLMQQGGPAAATDMARDYFAQRSRPQDADADEGAFESPTEPDSAHADEPLLDSMDELTAVDTAGESRDGAAQSEAPPARGATASPGWDVQPDPRRKHAATQPPRSAMLTERLGANIAVWLGSLALFLSGAFLVKYSFDAGLLTPLMRVSIGFAFGLVLLGAGEWLRNRSAQVAQGVTAAGVADLFACLLAATNLYHLIDRTTGFALLAATTAAAVVLSLRQGPFVALLGLIGGFATPALIGSKEPQPAPLFAYLLLLQGGLMVVSYRRRWWGLAALTQAGVLGWTAVWLAASYRPDHSIWIAPFLLASAVMFVLGTDLAGRGEPSTAVAWARPLSVIGAAASLIMLCILVGSSGFAGFDWVFLGLLSAAALVLGRISPRYEPLAWLAAAATLGLLAIWRASQSYVPPSTPRPPFDAVVFARALGGFGALFAAGGYAALWGAARPSRCASLSVLAAIGVLLIAYWGMPAAPLGLRWGLWCLSLAVVYAGATALVWKRRSTVAELQFVLAALIAGATSFVSLAAPIELERAWIAVAWAVEAPALAVIAIRLGVPRVAHLGALLTLLTGVWMLRPEALDYPLGDDPVLNWILYGYGIPLAAFALSAWLLWRRPASDGLEWHASLGELAAVVFALALVTVEIRHFFHGDALRHGRFSAREFATYVCAWLYLPLPMLWLARCHVRGLLRPAARVVAWAGMAAALFGLGVLYCPILRGEDVGATRILNHLLYWYGAPAMLAAVLAMAMQNRGMRTESLFAAGLCVLMLFMLVTLEVRQAFQGAILNRGITQNGEWYAYSAAWVVLGLLLMLAGVATRGLVLRWASLIVMLLAVGKVFLSDTAHLKDLYRVFSLFGLGVSLLLLAFLYQKFVFGGARRGSDGASSALSEPRP